MKRFRHKPLPQGKGFALVMTLVFMVLLSLLAVGALVLSASSMRRASQDAARELARSNARLALELAIGELQGELGPDRRVNCLAGIDEEVQAGQGQWLAVYDAWRSDEPQRPDAGSRFRRFLVSGDREALSDGEVAKVALGGEAIDISRDGRGGTVRVGLVPMESPRGFYAWWISDENSKAKISAGQDLPDWVGPELLALQVADSAPGTGFRMVGALGGIDVTGRVPWEMGDDLRAKSLSVASADLLPGVEGAVSGHHPDLTTEGYGLLSDVRNGILKRDLSLYLERGHGPQLQQPLYTVGGGSAVNFAPDSSSFGNLDAYSGITMEELWLYYNLYKEVNYERPASSDDRVGRRAAGFPTLLGGSTREEVIKDPFYAYRRRVHSQVKYMLSLAAVASASDPEKYDLRLAVDPVVVLWNPNNVALEYQTGGFTTVAYTGLPYDAVFETSSGTVSVPFTQFFNYQNVNLIRGLIGRDHPIVLQPGESRVFSRVEGRGDSLSSGWRYTEGTLLNHASFPKQLDRSATVRLTLRPAVSGGFLNYITYWFGERTQNPTLQSGTLILRGDTALGDLPTISSPQTLTVENIVDERKVPQMLLSYYMRTESDTRAPSKPWIWGNPAVSFRTAPNSSMNVRLLHQMEINVTPVSTWENPHVQITPGNQAYWGGGVRADFGVPFFTLRSVPLVPIKSVASFQHACANGFRRYWKDSNVSIPAFSFPSDAIALDGHRYLAPLGSKLIGNSYGHPLIPAAKTDHQVMATDEQMSNPVAAPMPVADHAYLANAALWDSWYFSSLTPQTAHPYESNPRELQEVFDDFFPELANEKAVPLPSARMSPYRRSGDGELRSLVSDGVPRADAYRKLAAHLLVDGAFNVNSTSVMAWKVMLGSLRDHASARMDEVSGGLIVAAAVPGSTPVTGLLVANGDLSSPSADTRAPAQWSGSRSLSDEEIDTLATELVREIRLRGPFLSLSDFINRRPGADVELARHGALQAAIEAAGLNGELDEGFRVLGPISGVAFPEAGRGSLASGIPGHISQADLLTPLGPVLQARSDTFTVRAYGSSTDREGNVVAEAWCEAVVQRVPDYVDPADAPDVGDLDLTSPVNQVFGRKMQVVGFRWLSAEEL